MNTQNVQIFTKFDLTGRTAIVTGGMGLLGAEYVKTLALAGAIVAIFDIQSKFPQHLLAMIEKGHDIKSFMVDITNQGSVGQGFDELVESVGTPTILINNAGLDSHPHTSISQNGPFGTYSEETWDAVIDSHLKGAFLMSRPDQSVYEYRRKRGEDLFKPVAYSVAKAGMIGFTKWLAEYGGPMGIRVNALVPGGVLANQGLEQEFIEQYVKRTMLKRMALPSDYNEAILFLASDASAYMTGANLVVDGGWTAR
ncbi:SDR family oxidoreductase [Candidatus Woesearchaeota archaeon]|nr:SDR family oxidoreductase [Candidatus Woesearchaeota archaeon]